MEINATHLVKLLLGIIGFIVGTIFITIHFIIKSKNKTYFSHYEKAETIVGHLKKYYFFMVAAAFYCISASGFISLIFYS